jgi:hypothetical protein
MKRCKNAKVNWAIFSDKYGIWLSDTEHTWYERDPNKVTDEEFNMLIENFNSKLKNFDEIWFYYNPGVSILFTRNCWQVCRLSVGNSV